MRVDEELLQLTTIAQLAQEEDERPHCGSVVGRQVIFRDRYAGFFRLMQDYFVDSPVYNARMFRRR
jgi:hypothetical protein